MDYSNNFDRLSTPMMVCSSDWKIVYKNRSCKKFLPVPKCGNYICKYFFDDFSVSFPVTDSGIERIELNIKGSYKSAICFEYFGYAIILFPIFLEYDVFGFDTERFFNASSADVLRSMIAVLNDEMIQNPDRYHKLECVKRYIYSYLENRLACSMLCTGEMPMYPAGMLYGLIKEKISSIVMKAGYRVQINIDGLTDCGDMFALNATNTSLVFANMLLFCLSVSENKTCYVDVSFFNGKIRNKIYFSVAENVFCEKTNSIDDFVYGKPAEYLNVLPFECMCNEFGWNVEYKIKTDGLFNASLSFDIGTESFDEFKSEDVFANGTNYVQNICAIVDRVLAAL